MLTNLILHRLVFIQLQKITTFDNQMRYSAATQGTRLDTLWYQVSLMSSTIHPYSTNCKHLIPLEYLTKMPPQLGISHANFQIALRPTSFRADSAKG